MSRRERARGEPHPRALLRRQRASTSPSSCPNSLSTPAQLGVVAAGHPLSAGAGADALRAGGNAVDAALAALLTSFVCEPLLTGLGAGGYMLVVEPGTDPVLLDFFVEAPGRGADPLTREPS